MSDLAVIRETIAQALDELSSAELIYRDTIQTLEGDIQRSRYRIVNLDDDIERAIIGLRSRVETAVTRSERALGELRLSRAQPDTYRIPANLNVQQTLELMRDLVDMCEETLRELETKAYVIITERKKWWKFW